MKWYFELLQLILGTLSHWDQTDTLSPLLVFFVPFPASVRPYSLIPPLLKEVCRWNSLLFSRFLNWMFRIHCYFHQSNILDVKCKQRAPSWKKICSLFVLWLSKSSLIQSVAIIKERKIVFFSILISKLASIKATDKRDVVYLHTNRYAAKKTKKQKNSLQTYSAQQTCCYIPLKSR